MRKEGDPAKSGMEVKFIADVYTDFPEKFGLPRQSGLVPELTGKIVFRPEYRDPQALRGIEGFSHLWILFDFSLSHRDGWSPTVRPPRLGGNARMGVFATRSPFRPNPVGLSLVKLEKVEHTEKEGDVIIVSGIDLVSGTPVIDVKPYLPVTDCRPDATGGFSEKTRDYGIDVTICCGVPESLSEEQLDAIVKCLRNDPRPSYIRDPERVYGMTFAGYGIRFKADVESLSVIEIKKKEVD